MKKKQIWLISSIILAVLLGWLGNLVWCAYFDLVSLNVRNMELRQVLKKIERQTWETIVPDKEMQGKITLRVKRLPLTEVLNIIGDQTSSRWTAMYPLYTSKHSLEKFKKVVVGELEGEQNGWSALRGRGGRGGPGGFGGRGGFGGFGGPGGPGGFGDVVREQNTLVSLKVDDKDLEVATMALARFAQAQIVPEDGTSGNVKLMLNQVKFDKAVAQLAERVHRKWAKVYSMRSFGDRGMDFMAEDMGEGRRGRGFRPDGEQGDRPPREFRREPPTNEVAQVPTEPGVTNAPPTNAWQVAREQRRQQFEQLQQVFNDSTTPEQRQQMEQRREQMRANPEAFRARFQGQMQTRGMNWTKNTTPEQWAERDKRRIERERQRAQWQNQNPQNQRR